MESITALRMNYHIHLAMKWLGFALVFASMGLVFHDYIKYPWLASINAVVALKWSLRMDRYAEKFKTRYADELEKLSYRVWGD